MALVLLGCWVIVWNTIYRVEHFQWVWMANTSYSVVERKVEKEFWLDLNVLFNDVIEFFRNIRFVSVEKWYKKTRVLWLKWYFLLFSMTYFEPIQYNSLGTWIWWSNWHKCSILRLLHELKKEESGVSLKRFCSPWSKFASGNTQGWSIWCENWVYEHLINKSPLIKSESVRLCAR